MDWLACPETSREFTEQGKKARQEARIAGAIELVAQSGRPVSTSVRLAITSALKARRP